MKNSEQDLLENILALQIVELGSRILVEQIRLAKEQGKTPDDPDFPELRTGIRMAISAMLMAREVLREEHQQTHD